jgi:hypothetical protein
MPKYRVQVAQKVIRTSIVTVTAQTRKEAKEKARTIANNGGKWSQGDVEDDWIEECEEVT